jgi:phospholipase C
MLENRSFDHIFGFRPGVNGLKGTESNLRNPAVPSSTAFKVGQNAPYFLAKTQGQGPGHSLNAANTQLCNLKTGPDADHPARNNGFVRNYIDELQHDGVSHPPDATIGIAMQSFTAAQLPAINALADAFCLCDNWYSEVPGPTEPNRLYLHMGTSAGFGRNPWEKHLFDNKTIYNQLHDAGKTWATYEFDLNEVRFLKKVEMFAESFKNFEQSFTSDAQHGLLPNFAFVLPRFNNDVHPANDQHAPNDMRYGEHLIADVYDALRANPDTWAKTVLVVTYDENGGFYDHILPPADNVPNPDGINCPPPDDDHPSFTVPFDFKRLGFRVPAIIASPWVKKGKVDSTRYQHTSVLATLKKLFNLNGFLTKRDASANAFDGLFAELSAPRTDTPQTLPRVALPAIPASLADPAHPANQPLDNTQRERLEGISRMAIAAGAVPPVTQLPTTQGGASWYIRMCNHRYTQLARSRYLQAKK